MSVVHWSDILHYLSSWSWFVLHNIILSCLYFPGNVMILFYLWSWLLFTFLISAPFEHCETTCLILPSLHLPKFSVLAWVSHPVLQPSMGTFTCSVTNLGRVSNSTATLYSHHDFILLTPYTTSRPGWSTLVISWWVCLTTSCLSPPQPSDQYRKSMVLTLTGKPSLHLSNLI